MSTKKYALITGASSGIGYALATELSRKGYTVIGCSPASVIFAQKPLEKEYGLISIPLDITDPENIKLVATQVEEITGGKLHILYNNAGISIAGPAIETDEKDLDKIFQVNVIGHINVTKYLSPQVINAKGTIVYTSSVAARVPLSWVSVYNATKAAIDAYALTLHGEMAPFGVRVHSVITGGVDTAICDANVKTTLGDSYYEVPGVYDSIRSSAMMSRDLNISPEKYAKEIVKELTRWRNPGFNLYHGARAYFLHWVSRWMPLWLVEFGVQYHFKQWKVLRTLARLVSQKRYTKKNQ
ncbi:hypothetical protein PVL30_005690 [Lodderomyces elongisporus]|uniref:NADPH-dependent 1-acyldihydroxyacetone phosphate reductase n=1 Tax=Lodderomyces elongisporus (strain ATCC 11503 / CBS 2605 / JCM 1781 / NBRC 1676 / NRRL YB-4239) TaxID=379508 RepID=A5E5Q9_LODEL|nr:uncharacterized protein PVL30_005690 [Lodderomyces elongisporus]EDK46767.1 conserved hypothetical protein [Lodderomyces elongisporus NRRL YB-4239]WLF81889.1 hypothetical protein PVL30_005690 [Lodderomyces elongisporus]